MSDDKLEAIDQFHQELKSMSAAGVPLDLGIEGPSKRLPAKLDQIRSALAVRVSLRQPLNDAIAAEESLPERYRGVARAWVRGGSPAAVLEAIASSPPIDHAMIRHIRLSLLQIVTILLLGFVGMMVAAVWLSPSIDAIYRQLEMTPSTAARWLSSAHATFPVWVAGVTVLFLVTGVFWVRSRGRWLPRLASRLPMVGQREELLRRARFADRLGFLLRHEVPLSEAVELASVLCPDRSPKAMANLAAHELAPNLSKLPPLLQWAVTGDLGDEPRWSVLDSIAGIYRRLAERRAAPWLTMIPLVLTAFLCGSFVLLYGLTVFLPVIGLLQDVAMPSHGPWVEH